MRIQASLKNIFFGIVGQLTSILMGFFVRTVFIYTLGVEYLGIEGLFTSIFLMLSLANLGFDTAIIYSLYKPLAERNTNKIQALMNLYKKAYNLVALTVLVIGLSLLPFLPYVIGGNTKIENINIIYVLFLFNSVISYLLVYKQAILIADQRTYIISKIHTIFIVISNIIQIILLLNTKNYIVILSLQLIFRIVENIYISSMAQKEYPFLGKNKVYLSQNEKNLFIKDLYSLLLYKISGVVINGTDNIIISKFIGITWVGMLSNYLLIISTLNTFLGHIFYSINASVGNLNVNEKKEKKYFVFNVLFFANFWVFGVTTIVLWNLLNPFIKIWLGDEFLFDKFIVLSILLNFYTTGMQNTATAFREATGLFKKGKYRPLIAAGLNLGVSIFLAQRIGLAGVFLGTVISRLLTFFWYDPYIIYKEVFKVSVIIYFKKYVYYFALVTVCILITELLSVFIDLGQIGDIGIKSLIGFVIPNFLFFLLYRNTEEFSYLINIEKKLLSNIRSRVYAKKHEVTFEKRQL